MSDTTNDTRMLHPVPDPDPLARLAGAPAVVFGHLITHPSDEGATAAELALATSLGRSTAGKALVTLEEHGLAIRTPGGHDGPHRIPDRWHATRVAETSSGDDSCTSEPTPTAPEPSTTNTSESEPGHTGDESTPADATATGGDDTSPDDGTSAADASVTHTPQDNTHQNDPQPKAVSGNHADPHHDEIDGSAAKNAPAPPASPEQPSPAPAMAAIQSGSKKRLAPGALRQMVIDHLQAHPGEAFTATKISRVIERSSGAIANTLISLVQQGIAEQTSDRPRTYRMATPDSNA
ncbi:hypothetical protein GQF42_35285 [Streptomyces broussonetiae]|uniref:Uncharacterized protein n=1 Tax=Streptomyces broussonetiae TaxID=2686304 RepID=A0A6I6N3Q8_9ACTN|nr:hypothetical protein [Streptomyces broussonetiae]QHA07858.1 hypothetical protein GQF42_35285 [Streptomyces broussonetiae]